jgi:hypothetical protein
MHGVQDVGEEVLNGVRERLARSRHVSEWDRGFTWRPNGVTQHLWSERPVRHASATRWRLQVRSRLFRGFDGSSVQLEALRAELSSRTPGAIVRSPDERSRLQLATTFHVDRANVESAARLIALVARLHVADVQRLTRSARLAATGVLPDVAEAAVGAASASGADGALGAALGASSVPPPPMTAALDALHAHDGVRAVPAPRGLLASVPCTPGDAGPRRALIEVSPSMSGGIGPGMRLVLSLPGYAEPLTAVTLNEEELSVHARNDLLGCWWAVDHVLRHVSFIPMVLCTADLMAHLSVAAVLRTRWASARVLERDAGTDLLRSRGRILRFPEGD